MFKVIHPNRWFIWTIVSIIVYGALIMWFVELYSIQQEIAVTENSAPITVSNRSSNKNHYDISKWKTYRNEEYGFEFKYPTGLDAVEEISSADGYMIGPAEPLKIIVGSLFFVVADTSELKALVDKRFYRFLPKGEISYTASSESGLYVSCNREMIPNTFLAIEGQYCYGEGGPGLSVKIESNDVYLFITSSPYDAKYHRVEDYKAILSTFKFTE